MDTGTFMNIVAYKYKEIKTLFKSRLMKIGIQFDEDLFNDSFIKCATKFNDDIITYDVVIKYFWTTYLNTIKSEFKNSEKLCFESIDNEIHDCIDNTYNEYIDDDYSKEIHYIIMNAIKLKYGESEMNIYNLYKYHEWTENDLILAGYDCEDLDKRIKAIHRFVKTYCKKHIIKERAN